MWYQVRVTSEWPMYSSVQETLDAKAPKVSSYTTTEVSSSIPIEFTSFKTRSGLSSDK